MTTKSYKANKKLSNRKTRTRGKTPLPFRETLTKFQL